MRRIDAAYCHACRTSRNLSVCLCDGGELVAWHSGRTSVGLWPANFPCPALDLQLMGDH